MRSRSDIEENQIEEDVNTDKDSSNPLVQKWKQFRPSKMERYLDIYYLIAILSLNLSSFILALFLMTQFFELFDIKVCLRVSSLLLFPMTT